MRKRIRAVYSEDVMSALGRDSTIHHELQTHVQNLMQKYVLPSPKTENTKYMPNLVTGRLEFNNCDVVLEIVRAARCIAEEPKNTRTLKVRSSCYFDVEPPPVPDRPGWYVITANLSAVYVGTAKSLHSRLMTDNGSRDNFLNPQRRSDPTRNYIKKFIDLGLFDQPKVILIGEKELVESANLGVALPLAKVEREAIEKLLSIYRYQLMVDPKG